MRLGGPVLTDYSTPGEWIDALEERGYAAATAPVGPDASDEEIAAYRDAAADADVEIAEVGAWGYNTISDDRTERGAAIEACARHLELADAIGARCAVNLAGSRGDDWLAPHPANFDEETFDRVVEGVRSIVDRAAPSDAVYALEPMPWSVPHSVESQRAVLEAVDREHFGVHFDPTNLITSPELWANDAALVEHFVGEFGDSIVAVHVKDLVLEEGLTVRFSEVPPGTGEFDLHELLTALDGLDPDLPLLLEHLDDEDAYAAAADHVRTVADEVGVDLRGS